MTSLISSEVATEPDGPGTGIMGVAPDATVRFYDNDSDPDAEGNQCGAMSETAATIRQAVDDGADIVNLSFAGPETTVGQRILDKPRQARRGAPRSGCRHARRRRRGLRVPRGHPPAW